MQREPPTIYLARHGETEWSKSGRHTGRTDLPLTANGEADGRRLGERLRGIDVSHECSAARSSRARRTAELAGFAPEIEPDLLEWNYGEYEGEDQRRDSRGAGRAGYLFRDGCPGGESAADSRRARGPAGRAKLKGLTGNVLCFAHGHLLRVLAARWVGQPVTFAGSLLLGTATRERPELRPRQPATNRRSRCGIVEIWNTRCSDKS